MKEVLAETVLGCVVVEVETGRIKYQGNFMRQEVEADV